MVPNTLKRITNVKTTGDQSVGAANTAVELQLHVLHTSALAASVLQQCRLVTLGARQTHRRRNDGETIAALERRPQMSQRMALGLERRLRVSTGQQLPSREAFLAVSWLLRRSSRLSAVHEASLPSTWTVRPVRASRETGLLLEPGGLDCDLPHLRKGKANRRAGRHVSSSTVGCLETLLSRKNKQRRFPEPGHE